MNKDFENDAGAPLPDLSARNISLDTIAPALGVQSSKNQPDYLDYDQKGRGVVVTMFANAGLAYLLGTTAGGVYGFRQGLASTPSTKFRVRLNSVLNGMGKFGSRAGNTVGVFAVMYSLYEGLGDHFELDRHTGVDGITPAFGAMMTGATYYAPSGIRVAGLAGSIGLGAVGATYAGYMALGKPYGSLGFLFL
mmetsp:Transcript_19181/g.54451  ORF Transcript_19181/g.54451 Transcript_19181/m.54451 type:complete len:193 (-) Transcript_19181:164-742(-)|eukprot:CAMPEP_0119560876 /NCGR_PEP_ID=MMETSP1352-20130426/16095_1 /TAXON_ID=265584 /ORGANISM="Stauroneis constricta, Strain CCMP1120" /LENGTH=192 /DNA_ID=CAMNT_0007608943 /DNA_START=184 /DNA_END=762 /DNA_ORIENTATION=+